MKRILVAIALILFTISGAHALAGFDLCICGLYGVDNFSFDTFNKDYAADLEDMGSGNAYGLSLTLDLPIKFGVGLDIRYWSETTETDEDLYIREITTDIVPLSLYLRYSFLSIPVVRVYGKIGFTSYNAEFDETWTIASTGDKVTYSYTGNTIGYFAGAGVQLKLIMLVVKLEVQYNMGEISAMDFLVPDEITDYIDPEVDVPVELDGMTLLIGIGVGF